MSMDFFFDIDRQILLLMNGSDSLFVDGLMLTYTMTMTWILFFVSLVFLVIKNNETMAQILVTLLGALFCFCLSEFLSDGLIKAVVARPRPCNDPSLRYLVDVVNGYAPSGFSFVSAHASNTMSIAVFISMVVRSKQLTVSLLLWSIINCITRIYLGVHYPSDVIAGIICGVIVGLVSFFLFKTIFKRVSSQQRFISSQYTKTGYNHSDIDVVILSFIVSLLLGVLVANFSNSL